MNKSDSKFSLMTTATGLTVLLAFLMLTGCAVPNAASYYRPSVAVSSEYHQGHCVPLERYLSFTTVVGNRSFNTRATGFVYTSDGHPLLGAQYVISGKWESIELSNSEASLVVDDKIVPLQPFSVTADESQYTDEKSFNINITFEHNEVDSYEIIFPMLLIDGEEVVLPRLGLEKTWWFGISPFNC